MDLDHTSEDEARYEQMYLSILQKEGNIESFLDTVFRFLYRRSDFFLTIERDKQPYGFLPGAAKDMVLRTFKKYDLMSNEQLKARLEATNEEALKRVQSVVNKKANDEAKSQNATITNSTNSSTAQSLPQEASSSSQDHPLTPEQKLELEQKIYQSDSSSYNGAIREKYAWTQTIKDIDVRVKIDPGIRSSKQVNIKIGKESLKVTCLNETKTWTALVDDKLPWKVKTEDSTWSLFPGDHIHVNLEKFEERWWEQLLASEDKLALRNMNPEKPMSDLDEEAQAKINQMMFDEQQKRLGLPTSEQIKTSEMLKNAWDAEGSPFKGTPFDPSFVSTMNNIS